MCVVVELSLLAKSIFPCFFALPSWLAGQELPACHAAVPCAMPELVAGDPAWASPRWPCTGGTRMGGGE